MAIKDSSIARTKSKFGCVKNSKDWLSFIIGGHVTITGSCTNKKGKIRVTMPWLCFLAQEQSSSIKIMYPQMPLFFPLILLCNKKMTAKHFAVKGMRKLKFVGDMV